jgi:hypothetical protein
MQVWPSSRGCIRLGHSVFSEVAPKTIMEVGHVFHSQEIASGGLDLFGGRRLRDNSGCQRRPPKGASRRTLSPSVRSRETPPSLRSLKKVRRPLDRARRTVRTVRPGQRHPSAATRRPQVPAVPPGQHWRASPAWHDHLVRDGIRAHENSFNTGVFAQLCNSAPSLPIDGQWSIR